MRKERMNGRMFFGILVIAIGVGLILSNFNVIPIDLSIATFWPSILILLGVMNIVNQHDSTFWGAVLIVVGGYFQLKNLDVFFMDQVDFVEVVIPLLVIVFGLSLIFNKSRQ